MNNVRPGAPHWCALVRCCAPWCVLVHPGRSGAPWGVPVVRPGAPWCVLVCPTGAFWCVLLHPIGALWCAMVRPGVSWCVPLVRPGASWFVSLVPSGALWCVPVRPTAHIQLYIRLTNLFRQEKFVMYLEETCDFCYIWWYLKSDRKNRVCWDL